MNAVGALQLLSDHESLKSVRDPLLKACCCHSISLFHTVLIVTLRAGVSGLEKRVPVVY